MAWRETRQEIARNLSAAWKRGGRRKPAVRTGSRCGGDGVWAERGFRQELLDRMAGQLGEPHAGELRRESAEAKAERIIAEELARLDWTGADQEQRYRSAAEKLALAARLRRETTLTIRDIAQRLHLGSWKSATTRLHNLKRKEKERATKALL